LRHRPRFVRRHHHRGGHAGDRPAPVSRQLRLALSRARPDLGGQAVRLGLDSDLGRRREEHQRDRGGLAAGAGPVRPAARQVPDLPRRGPGMRRRTFLTAAAAAAAAAAAPSLADGATALAAPRPGAARRTLSGRVTGSPAVTVTTSGGRTLPELIPDGGPRVRYGSAEQAGLIPQYASVIPADAAAGLQPGTGLN